MGKKILAVYFTQSGQTKTILDHFLRPVVADGNDVEYLHNQPVQPFPFPWSTEAFFDTVPESVSWVPTPLQEWQTAQSRYDLIVLAWQPWNLSPSIPFSSILQDERFKALIRDTPVITLCGCRNMWINAQEKNKQLLRAAGARLVGNIALVDRHPNHLSYFTIFHWLGTGRKDRKWGIFPKPGVSDKDIAGVSKYGGIVKEYLRAGEWEGMQAELVHRGAAPVRYSLMFIELKAGKIFKKWVALIHRNPEKRKSILIAYKYYLAVALLMASPVILMVDCILFRPFAQKKIKRQMQYYSGIEYREKI